MIQVLDTHWTWGGIQAARVLFPTVWHAWSTLWQRPGVTASTACRHSGRPASGFAESKYTQHKDDHKSGHSCTKSTKKIRGAKKIFYNFLKDSDIKWHFDLVIYWTEFMYMAQSFECQVWCAADAGSNPHCCKGFFSKSQLWDSLKVFILLLCQCAIASHVKNPTNKSTGYPHPQYLNKPHAL